MVRYFFDTRDNDEVIPDDVGLECVNLEAVKVEAAKSLAELARDVLPGSLRRRLGVDVRDENHRLVMIVELTFEARVLLPDAA
jgi:anthranilate phosphoribosyltransferase